MKKSYILLMFMPLVLVSCNKNDTPEIKETIEEKILKELSTGYRANLNFEISEKWGEDEPTITYHITEVSQMKDYTSYVEYEATQGDDDSLVKGNLTYNSTYSHLNEDGKEVLTLVTLGIDNVIRNEILKDDSTDEPYLWDEYGMNNGFSALKVTDLTLKEDNTYLVNLDKLDKTTLNNLSTTFYGMSGFDLTTLQLTVKDNKLDTISGIYKQKEEEIMGNKVLTDVYFSGNFVSIPSGEDAVRNIKPLEGVEDENFVNAMNKLKSHNFESKLVTKSGNFPDDGKEKDGATAIVKATKDSFTYETYYANGNLNVSSGVYKIDDSTTQQVSKINGVFYKNGAETKLNYPNDYLPNFNISSLFFKKEGNVYTLDHDKYYNGYDTSYVFSTLSGNEISDLKITVNDDSIEFNNFIASGAHSASKRNIETYSNLGNVNDTIKLNEVKDTIKGLTWSDIFKNNASYSEVLSLFNNDESLLNEIPTTEDNHSLINLYVDSALESLEFQFNNLSSEEEGNTLVTNYSSILVNHGFSTPTLDKYGTYTSTKVINNYEISVSYYCDFDYTYSDYYFVIMPSVSKVK